VLGNLRRAGRVPRQQRPAHRRPQTGARSRTPSRRMARTPPGTTPRSRDTVDLDTSKQVQRHYGHEKGDELLASVGAALSDASAPATSSAATAARSSFSCCPTPTRPAALIVAEKIHHRYAPSRIPGVERTITPASAWPPSRLTPETRQPWSLRRRRAADRQTGRPQPHRSHRPGRHQFIIATETVS